MKLKLSKVDSEEKGEVTPDDETKEVAPTKKTKLKVKAGKHLPTTYNKYSGVVDENGKSVDNPTELQAMKTMVKYMKNNQSDQGSNPSNVYRPEFQQHSITYDKKKGSTTS